MKKNKHIDGRTDRNNEVDIRFSQFCKRAPKMYNKLNNGIFERGSKSFREEL